MEETVHKIADHLDECLTLLQDPLVGLTSEEKEIVRRCLEVCSGVLRRDVPAHGDRANDVFSKFLRLLAEYYTRERGVGFYADKLFLSPKYFSRLVKSASGRGAPEWIDTYVVLAAKRLLKNTDLSIKQVVYELHFPDQPAFTKYFKNHTGQTPAQFRKSLMA